MNASRPRTRRPVEPPPIGKIPASQPTLRESISFTVASHTIDLAVPPDVIGWRAGRSLVLRLAGHVELLCERTRAEIVIELPAEEGTTRRGTVRIEGPVGAEFIRVALHQAAAALLREVVS